MLFLNLADIDFDKQLHPVDHFMYPPGTVIYDADSGKKFIYIIRTGMVKLTCNTHNGVNRIVRLAGAETSLGLELLDGSNHYHHTATAIDHVELCRIPLTTIQQILELQPSLYMHIARQLQNQLALSDQWIVTLGTGTAKQRVAQLLLVLNNYFSDSHGAFKLINREDMAAMIGITVETASRMIANFKRQNILYKHNRSFYGCNAATLQEVARHS